MTPTHQRFKALLEDLNRAQFGQGGATYLSRTQVEQLARTRLYGSPDELWEILIDVLMLHVEAERRAWVNSR